jgi:hypothetical protein
VTNLLRDLTSRFDRTLKSMIYAAAAAAAAVVALFFFSLAAFLLLRDGYGTKWAALVMGAVYAVLALIALVVVLLLGRTKAPPPAAAPRSPPLWQDPIVITSALQVARSLGPRTLITLAAVGAFVAGILLTGSKSKPPDKNEP